MELIADFPMSKKRSLKTRQMYNFNNIDSIFHSNDYEKDIENETVCVRRIFTNAISDDLRNFLSDATGRYICFNV